MRIHRLVLDDFRGVEHRELLLPEAGVVVLEGANEVGKSSTLEALDMLLTEKHSSKKASVLAVKPVHRDAPSAVEAEISSGPYRFTLRKQWHSRPATTLTVHAPRAEQHTGDEAHRRARQILDETLDVALWDALRMLQTSSPDTRTLSGSAALAAALDAAAGANPAPEGDGAQTLFDAAAARAAEFWTATFRPTGRYRSCTEELAQARADAQHARTALDVVTDDARRHGDLTGARREVQAAVEARTEAAEALVRLVTDLQARRGRLDQARERFTQARRAAAEAEAALSARRREVVDVRARQAALADARTAVDALTADVEAARQVATSATEVATARSRAAEEAQEAAGAAREASRRSQDGAALVRVRRRIAEVTAAAGQVREATTALERHRVDAATVRRIEAADDAVRGLRARAEAAAAHVVVDATAVEVVVDGTPVSAGTVAERTATRPTLVDVAGFATIRILPGADTGSLADDLDAAESTLSGLLAAAGVEDVATARAALEERRSAQAALDLARSRLTQLTADGGPHDLQAEADRLVTALAGADDDAPPVAQALSLDEARRREAAAEQAAREMRQAAREATGAATAATGRAEALGTGLAARRAALEVSRTETDSALERLAQARARHDDDALSAAAEQTRAVAEHTAEEVAALESDLTARDADSTLARAQQVQVELAGLVERRDSLDAELVRLDARLSVMGGEARQEVWDEAASAVRRLEAEHEGLTRRAASAKLLLDTLDRHRGAMRRRYVSPFTDRLEELGRTVYGESFRITLDDDLRIVDRTLQGRTVGYDQLSTGTKEQLAVLTRLACATLVDPADGVPVVLDDALGHSDPGRLHRLAAVFEHVAPQTQVLLLAPGPGVHSSIAGATVIRLDPDATNGTVSGAAAPAASASRD